MPGYWVPKSVVFGELPKTATGKIQKHLLRARAREMGPVKMSRIYSAFGAMLDLTLYKPGENCCFRSAVINYVSPHSSQRVISMGSGRLIDGTWQARVLIG
ncbi:acetyl-coenzyme A synthetase [Striga asiatica]|uniref:Acetyl-coenzyme A synthetase n=1 Tax=Striga asiatica TaxID=4170 RepID=A0A5A7PF78_STRAF|nr:acetyl-coenzyme A synthetase [Striga asiatica]